MTGLIITGLVLLPFYELIFRVFPYVNVITPSTREPKEFMAVTIALAIGLLSIHKGKIKSFGNKWLLLLVGFHLLSIRLALKPPLVVNDIEIGNFWVWKATFLVLCYFLMIVAVASMELNRSKIEHILKVVTWCGFIMAVYVILQRFGLDQFYKVKAIEEIGSVTRPEIFGTLGQSTLVASFIAMLVPVSLYFRRKTMLVTMIVAIFITQSEMAIGAMLVSIALFFVLCKPRRMIIVFLIVLALGSIYSLEYKKGRLWTREVINDNARFANWEKIINDWKGSPIHVENGDTFPFTGVGPGSLTFIYHAHNQPNAESIRRGDPGIMFMQAHNEYLEILYNLGKGGLILFLLSIFYMVTRAVKAILRNADYHKPMIASILCSFVCFALCALGSFVFQLGAHQYYGILFVGLLHNQSLLQGGGRCLGKS